MEKLDELIAVLKCGLFVTPDTLEDASAAVHKLAKGSPNPADVYTAVHMTLNAVAKQLEAMK